QVCAQLCRRPCYCPWVPPRCPRGSPLVLDGCGCCKICARRLGEPCDFLHVCDQNQGLVCDYSSAPAGTGGTCNCEHGGAHFPRGYPHTPAQHTAQLQPSPHMAVGTPQQQREVAVKHQQEAHLTRPAMPAASQGSCTASNHPFPLMSSLAAAGAVSPVPRYPCQEWGTEWSACSATCGLGFATRVSNQNRYCRLETQRRLCMARPCPALPAAFPAVS
ncbi:WISP2 protein, partial [Pomatorhinus ruficollis]|nr:WISP2 protein [Pomatorhinus ruficollis]